MTERRRADPLPLGGDDGLPYSKGLMARELDLPIVLLIGGATGTGKSTVATEVAYRLGITRVSSTDFVRQTMRAFLSPQFMPSIHRSSFDLPEEDDLRDVL